MIGERDWTGLDWAVATDGAQDTVISDSLSVRDNERNGLIIKRIFEKGLPFVKVIVLGSSLKLSHTVTRMFSTSSCGVQGNNIKLIVHFK